MKNTILLVTLVFTFTGLPSFASQSYEDAKESIFNNSYNEYHQKRTQVLLESTDFALVQKNWNECVNVYNLLTDKEVKKVIRSMSAQGRVLGIRDACINFFFKVSSKKYYNQEEVKNLDLVESLESEMHLIFVQKKLDEK